MMQADVTELRAELTGKLDALLARMPPLPAAAAADTAPDARAAAAPGGDDTTPRPSPRRTSGRPVKVVVDSEKEPGSHGGYARSTEITHSQAPATSDWIACG